MVASAASAYHIHDVVSALGEGDAAQPDAKERADLMGGPFTAATYWLPVVGGTLFCCSANNPNV